MSRASFVERDGREGLPEGFEELPAQVYRDDPYWIPESTPALRAAFSAANPWFARGRALCLSVPERARLAAFRIPGHCIDGEEVAYFGFFESRGDAAAEAALFERACGWAAQQGARVVYGPIHFDTYGRYRLRVDAERSEPPFPGEPYNPVGYPALLEAQRFTPCLRYRSLRFPHEATAPIMDAAKEANERIVAQGFRIEPLGRELWMELLPRLKPLADAIFGDNFGYVPLSEAAFRFACGESFIRRHCERSSVVAFAPNGDVAGVLLVLPHYGPLLMQGAGEARVAEAELDSRVHLPALERLGPPCAVFKTVGVHPDYQGLRLFDFLLLHTWQRAGGLYPDVWYALAREDNRSLRALNRVPGPIEHEYALYRRAL